MPSDKNRKITLWHAIVYGLKINFKHMPFAFIAFGLVALANSIGDVFVMFGMQQFFDSVEDMLVRNEPIKRVYMMVAILGITFVVVAVINGARSMIFMVLIDKLHGEMSKTVHAKMARISSIYMEDTRFHDDIEKALSGANDMIVFVVNWGFTMIIMYYLPYFLFLSIYLHYLKPSFVFAVVALFLPALFAQFVRTRIISKLEDETAPLNRESKHYYDAITSKEYFKETRFWGAYSFFRKRFIGTLECLSKAEWKAAKHTNMLELSANILSAAGYVVVIVMLVMALLRGEISVGAFAAVFASIGMMTSNIEDMIKNHFGAMTRDMGKAQNFFRYMEMPERAGVDMKAEYEKGITAEGISFTYPSVRHKSIDDVSLSIRAGETIAIVGENGAGKTTLVRLLIGLYKPDAGRVILGGMDTDIANERSLFCKVSGVFQRFQKYAFTLRENIKAGDFTSNEPIDTAITLANVEIDSDSYPNGKDTMLSREYGGVDLSGGEWQRVAIARGLYRGYHIIVLDEPTAAIDPYEESRIYRQFVDISRDKTTIIVTHRLGSTKIADRVVVMGKGTIVDVGTHNELMQRGGLYADMFNAQAEWYEDESIEQ